MSSDNWAAADTRLRNLCSYFNSWNRATFQI